MEKILEGHSRSLAPLRLRYTFRAFWGNAFKALFLLSSCYTRRPESFLVSSKSAFSISSRYSTIYSIFLNTDLLPRRIFVVSQGDESVFTDKVREVMRFILNSFEGFCNPIGFALTTFTSLVVLAGSHCFRFFPSRCFILPARVHETVLKYSRTSL